MSKTTQQIAKDCWLSKYASDVLSLALKTDTAQHPIYAIKDEIIQSLYRRIEKLEGAIAEALRVADLEQCDEFPDPIGDALEIIKGA